MFGRLLTMVLIAAFSASTPVSAADWVARIDIPAASPAPWPAEFGAVDINIPCPYTMSGKCDLDGFLDWQNVCALYVLSGGQPALYRERSEKGACKSNRKRERYGVASITKSVVSLLYGEALSADPALAIDRPAAEALAKVGVAYPREDVTIRDLLQMSSGMKWRDRGPEAAVIRITTSGGAGDPATLAKSVNAFLPKATFGGRGVYNYSGFDTTMIGLIADGGQRRLETLFRTKLWSEIGAGRAARWKADEGGTPAPYCCLQMGPEDLAKIGQWVLDALKQGGARAGWIRASVTDTRPSRLKCSADGDRKPVAYGYQWWVPPLTDGGFTAIGKGGQYLHIFPKQNVVIAQLSDDRRAGSPTNSCGAFFAHRAIANALAR